MTFLDVDDARARNAIAAAMAGVFMKRASPGLTTDAADPARAGFSAEEIG